MALSLGDVSHWLALNEDALFLHDGLIRVTDLVELPHDVQKSSPDLEDHLEEVLNFEANTPKDLCDKIASLCKRQNNEYARLLEYRLNALQGLWKAQKHFADEHREREATEEEAAAMLKRKNLWQPGEQINFSSRVSLLLVFPLLQSQAEQDPRLCGTATQLLLHCLRDCAPLSLFKEPADCLDGLEHLLCSWLEDENRQGVQLERQKCIAAALTVLSCARGIVKTFLHTIHLLQRKSDLGTLAVKDSLQKLTELEGGIGSPPALLGPKHILCWGYDDMLNINGEKDEKETKTKEKDSEPAKRSLTCDGSFLYTTNSNGQGISKIGTGLCGTLRGYPYVKNTHLHSGFIAWGNGILLHRPYDMDGKGVSTLALVLSPLTLQPIGTVNLSPDLVINATNCTVQLCSDGMEFYFVRCVTALSEKNKSAPCPVYLDCFRIVQEGETYTAQTVKKRTVLTRKDDGIPPKVSGESLLSRLRPYRSATATLVALTGPSSSSGANSNQEVAINTSCGLPLKVLMSCPMFTCGTYITILTPVPGQSGNTATRTIFGSTAGMCGVRTLASNISFTISDGQFHSRSDLVDAPSCTLARGAPLAQIAVAYDAPNNFLWATSSDWADQFHNPGHQVVSFIRLKLGLEEISKKEREESNEVTILEACSSLLRHVGFTSSHQLACDMLSTFGCLPQRLPLDAEHLTRALEILETAVTEGDGTNSCCVLIMLQVMFKVRDINLDNPSQKLLFDRMNDLLWKLIKSSSSNDKHWWTSPYGIPMGMRAEACRVVSAGFVTLYPLISERNSTLSWLLTDGSDNPAIVYLRDLILCEYTDQLQNICAVSNMQTVLPDELLHVLFKIVVKEANQLFMQCVTDDREQFEKLLTNVPVASVSLRYLSAVQSHYLSVLTLTSDGDGPQTKLKNFLFAFASRVFSSSYEVLEVLLEVSNSIINKHKWESSNYYLQGLERIAKSTLLGYLLPTLFTTMTHHHILCVNGAEMLMPQLVQLVILTSQAALVLKSKNIISKSLDEIPCISHPSDDSIGSSNRIDEQEEPGFLAGLKIPAPWATGRSVESIHPVRDNYKFKETVQIPGARCLYLRFDQRCSSQYDYDKLIVYAGPTTNSSKVAEYGGNTQGFGSRSVLGSGWPKDLVKVEGDTVTFVFEMRSGREHNTPDRAMWGFLVTVRAQESAEEVSFGLPFLADLALGLSVLACCMLHILYEGPKVTTQEEECIHLLQSKLLQRCEWHGSTALASSPVLTPEHSESCGSPIPLQRIKLSTECLRKLRDMSSCPAPQLRASISEVLQVDVLEEAVMSAIMKHFSLEDVVRSLAKHESSHTPEYYLLLDVVCEAYKKLDALVRRLQVLAELESKWMNEVYDVQQNPACIDKVFFLDSHLSEIKSHELTLLCYLKNVNLNATDLESTVVELRTKLLEESKSIGSADITVRKPTSMSKTQTLLHGILERAELLLAVNINTGFVPQSQSLMTMTKSFTGWPVQEEAVTKAKDSPHRLSLPCDLEGTLDDSILQIPRLKRKRLCRKWKGPDAVLQDIISETPGNLEKPSHCILLDQLFSFIGSNPEKAVSCESFLAAARVRCRRGETRQQALVHMKELLTAASRVGGGTHLVAAVSSVLQKGPRIDELACGGMSIEVRDAFAETMTSVVQLAANYPFACRNSIGLLCVIPYTRNEERCLVRSGLVSLLDRLCSLTNTKGDARCVMKSDCSQKTQQLSLMAWAGFQVLANRCVQWEEEDEGLFSDDLEQAGLARQVSQLLTNHLTRATNCSGNEAAGNEAFQEVLSLLNSLAKSKMGKAILSQPACVSKLLSLLLDVRLSPKLVLILLQLCHVALPLMGAEDCAQIVLPQWIGSNENVTADNNSDDPAVPVATLLLAKLADYLVPGCQTTVTPQSSTDAASTAINKNGSYSDDPGNVVEESENEVGGGKYTIYLHKREDQTSRDIVQQLVSASAEMRLLRIGRGTNVESLDREMSKRNKTEIITEDVTSAMRRATKLAQNGLVVSVGIPQENVTQNDQSDKKKTADVLCKERNAELAKSDPVRPFISGQVANSMAYEVISLMHSLLGSTSAHVWKTAVERVLIRALEHLTHLSRITDTVSTSSAELLHSFDLARRAVAALAALGGFTETVKPGAEVTVTGPGIEDCQGTVLSIEMTGLASVRLSVPEDSRNYPHPSAVVSVPVSRLQISGKKFQISNCLPLTEHIVTALQNFLLPENNGKCPLQSALPTQGDGNTLVMALSRLIAEIRTRACMVLATYLQDVSFAFSFLHQLGHGIELLKSLSMECLPADRLRTVELQCNKFRQLYRDCIKPQPPPNRLGSRSKEMTWDPSRSFPPVRACLFSRGLMSVSFLGDPAVGSGLPRGTLIYATQPIPQSAPSFYWELEIISFGEPQDESGPGISFGFAPNAERKDGAWTSPVGTVFFHNNGRVVHYNGSSLLQWKSIRLDVQLNPGDTAGIGWERTSYARGTPAWGQVFFTHNGIKQAPILPDVLGGMWPVVHIQKKSTSIRANFGAQPFAYAEGQMHQKAALEASDSSQDICATFCLLPFHGSDSESELSERGSATALSTSTSETDFQLIALRSQSGQPYRVAATPKPNREYVPEQSIHFALNMSNDMGTVTGLVPTPAGSQVGDISDLDESADADVVTEDLNSLLVKAWESKVFPVIRRRFRNETERKDGLEQIKGALQLGMTDIARQTVEYLYEETGGIPSDLHLPTVEDIKEEVSKFTIDRVKKGTAVVVRNVCNTGTSIVLPKFGVQSMLKTFGLMGEVLEIDVANELVQVETYLRSEGVLVRYWYPLQVLERPPQGVRKTAVTGAQILDTNNIQIHRELLNWEYALSRMYCRAALLELINQCNIPGCLLNQTDSTRISTTIAASAAVLRDLDVENLQLLSNDLLMSSPPGGNVIGTNLSTKTSDDCLRVQRGLPSDLFYGKKERLQKELQSAITRAAKQGEDLVIELSNQICVSLQLAPEGFHLEEVSVGEAKMKTDIQFPGAAFVIVSCKSEEKKKETSENKASCIRIYTYDGHHVCKNGQVTFQEVMSYPQESVGNLTVTHNAFPAVILAADKVHARVLDTQWKGLTVVFHGLPAQFPLALIYLEELLRLALLELPSDKTSRKPLGLLTTPILVHAVELLCGFLWRTDMPPLLKEPLFLLLAELLRTIQCFVPREDEVPLPHLSLMLQLQLEVKRLYEEETKEQTNPSIWSGFSGTSGTTEQWRFSTYFQSLLEVAMVIAELTSPLVAATTALCPPVSPSLPSTVSGTEKDDSSQIVPPPSPSSSSRRKIKLPARRDKEGRPMRSRSGSTSPRNSAICDPDSSTSLTSKAEDLLWFHRALTLSQILRYITFGDKKGAQVTADAVSDAAQSLCVPKAHSRLLVATGIPTHLSQQEIHWAVIKALRSTGGLFKEEIYIPTTTTGSLAHDNDSNKTDEKKSSNLGWVVLEVRSRAKVEAAKKALYKSKALRGQVDIADSEPSDVNDIMIYVNTVNSGLQTGDSDTNPALELYLLHKLFEDPLNEKLCNLALNSVTEVFHSCFLADQRLHLGSESPREETEFICLSRAQILAQIQGNLLHSFFSNTKQTRKSLSEHVSSVLAQYGITKMEDKELFKGDVRTDKNSKQFKKRLFKEKQSLGQVQDECSLEKSQVQDQSKSETDLPSAGTGTKVESSSKDTSEYEEKFLTLDGFVQYVTDLAKQDVQAVWLGLFACGFDLHYDRCCVVDSSHAQHMSEQWNVEKDSALVSGVNALCQHLAILPSHLHPNEIYFTSAQLSSVEYSSLQGIPIESIRLRFSFLQSLNNSLETFFLPLMDLRLVDIYPHSTAALLSAARSLIFYDCKIFLLNRILNATARRGQDQASPEIILDPLEVIGKPQEDVQATQFCQAMSQLKEIHSSMLCVPLASGGDPTYSFNVKLTGEEVHGTSGSFRHFLSQVRRELQSPLLSLLVPCPSGSANKHKGHYLLKPGPMNYGEEKMLQFLGQLLGITMRADIPLPLELMPVVWKGLLELEIDAVEDLKEADVLTYSYLKEFDIVENENDLQELLETHQYPKFVYSSLTGEQIELAPNGSSTPVSWENYKEYTNIIRELRLKELKSTERFAAIRAGLASIVPLQCFDTLMSPDDLESRLCGLPEIDLDFLKAHTLYQVSLLETDTHIEYFWAALETFSQDELRRFVKFACNQDRIPMTCPCKDGGLETVHVPPYPMKIAPADARPGDPNERHIRVETCLFMIKLPQYSSLEITTEKLLFAIHARDDPLSG